MALPPNDHPGPSALAQVNTAREPVLLQAEFPRNNSPTQGVSGRKVWRFSPTQGPCHSRIDSYHVYFHLNTTTHPEFQVFSKLTFHLPLPLY